MSDDRARNTGCSIGFADRDRRQQLWEAAVVGEIIDVDFGTAAAILAVVGSKELTSLVHFQRFPWIEHRCRLQIAHAHGGFGVSDVDDRYAVGCRIAAR